MTCSRSIAFRENTGRPTSPPGLPPEADWFVRLAGSLDQPDVRKALSTIGVEIDGYFKRLDSQERQDLGSLDDFIAITREHWSLQGGYIKRLAEYVDVLFDKIIGETWNPVPIGLLPVRAYNASSVATNDGKAILLNYGFVRHLRMFWKAFLGFASYRQVAPEPEPMCRHLRIFDFAISMGLEAVALTREDFSDWPSLMGTAACLRCPASHWEHYADTYIIMSELFVILHEIAHIVLGHLNTPTATTPLESQALEYAADEWAVLKLISVDKDSKAHANDVALCAGIFLVLLELTEDQRQPELRTHPLPVLRRARINELCGVTLDDGSSAGELHRIVLNIQPICGVASDLLSSILEKRITPEVLRSLAMLMASIEHSGPYSDASNFFRRDLWSGLVDRSGVWVNVRGWKD